MKTEAIVGVETDGTIAKVPVDAYDNADAYTKEQLWESVKKLSDELDKLRKMADNMEASLLFVGGTLNFYRKHAQMPTVNPAQAATLHTNAQSHIVKSLKEYRIYKDESTENDTKKEG